MNHRVHIPDQPPAIVPHDHVAEVLGRAVVARPTRQTLEAVSAWHMTRFWRSLANTIPAPRFGFKRRTLAHA